MLRLVGALFRRVRQRPVTFLAALLLLGAAIGGGANLWAYYHYHAAKQDLATGHLKEARRHIGQCLPIWWSSVSTHLLAARIDRLTGHYPEAEAHLNECKRRAGSTNDAIQLEWLLLRAQSGELDEVEPGLLYAVEKGHPESRTILETLSLAYIQHQRFLHALISLNEWLKRDPDNVRALDWRGWVQERLQNQDAAMADYRRALELDPGRDEIRIRLVLMILQTATPLDAKTHLEEHLLKTQPERAEVLIGLARCRYVQGKADEARALLDKVLAADPDNAHALYRRAEIALLAEKPAEAEPYLRRALKKDPTHAGCRRLLADCLAQQPGREEEAAVERENNRKLEKDMRELSRLLSMGLATASPTDATVPSQIGEIYLRLGEEKYGLYFLEIVALRRDPGHRKSYEILARYYEGKKDRTKDDEKTAEFYRNKLRQSDESLRRGFLANGPTPPNGSK